MILQMTTVMEMVSATQTKLDWALTRMILTPTVMVFQMAMRSVPMVNTTLVKTRTLWILTATMMD